MVRRPLPEDPEEAQQLSLLKVGRFAYSAFVTNLELQPWMIWKTYQARANAEKSVRELLQYFSLNKIPTQRWVANVAFLQLLAMPTPLPATRCAWAGRTPSLAAPAPWLHCGTDCWRASMKAWSAGARARSAS